MSPNIFSSEGGVFLDMRIQFFSRFLVGLLMFFATHSKTFCRYFASTVFVNFRHGSVISAASCCGDGRTIVARDLGDCRAGPALHLLVRWVFAPISAKLCRERSPSAVSKDPLSQACQQICQLFIAARGRAPVELNDLRALGAQAVAEGLQTNVYRRERSRGGSFFYRRLHGRGRLPFLSWDVS